MAQLPQPEHSFTVARSITIEAPAEEIWPLLLSIPDIAETEGRWNITQNLLSVPRPREAVVSGDGAGAVRRAQWGDHISFEEHITDWVPGERLGWRFEFPNDSVQHYTDRHISPDGTHLRIDTGGYRLIALSPERTKLQLQTTYHVRTPVNHYGALWGQLILGDIQSNILHLIKVRTEES